MWNIDMITEAGKNSNSQVTREMWRKTKMFVMKNKRCIEVLTLSTSEYDIFWK